MADARRVLLYDLGGSWEVVGPAELIVCGEPVEAYAPQGRRVRTVVPGAVQEYKGVYGDGTWVRGIPSIYGKVCGLPIPNKGTCNREHAHPGWCKPAPTDEDFDRWVEEGCWTSGELARIQELERRSTDA